ncbi:hypothetical protein UM181_14950 [Alphaproteobacteria bacterium US3C007]|nr:hypothetical protein UM181_14950 [Alphaproteobacteria bacterium US3C007]
MSRTIPSALLTALSQPEVQPYYAVELDFDTAPVRLWTGYGDRDIGVNTYIGAGNLLTIGGLEEVNDLSAKNITLTLSGVPSSLVSIALNEPYQRREAKVYFGTIDTTTPIEVFSGIMNTMTIEDSAETSVISVSVESKLVRLERSSNRRYTHENHVSRHAGDTFFSFVADLQDKDVIWGREKA